MCCFCSLTMLTLILTHGLRCAQPCYFLWGFWVNDGGVAALQVLSDGWRVTVAIFQFPFQEVLIQLREAFQSLHWTGNAEFSIRTPRNTIIIGARKYMNAATVSQVLIIVMSHSERHLTGIKYLWHCHPERCLTGIATPSFYSYCRVKWKEHLQHHVLLPDLKSQCQQVKLFVQVRERRFWDNMICCVSKHNNYKEYWIELVNLV